MSFAFVQGNSANAAGGSVSVSLTGTAEGNLLFVMTGNTGNNTYAISDSGGNEWSSVAFSAGSPGNTGTAQAFWAVAKGGDTEITIVASPGSGLISTSVAIGEWSGAATWALDKKAINFSVSDTYTSVTSPSVTTTKASELLIGMMLLDMASITWTAGTGYTSRVAFAGSEAILLEDQTVSSTGTYSASATFNSTAGGIHGGIAAFYDVAAVSKESPVELFGTPDSVGDMATRVMSKHTSIIGTNLGNH